MNKNYLAEQSLKSRSSSGERDDSFEILCFEDVSDTESDSFTEVTVEEINCFENRKEEETFSLFNFPSRVLKYFNPIVVDHDEELQEDEIYLIVASETTKENATLSKELQETETKEEGEPNNNEVILEENQREVAEDSENSEVEYNFPDLDLEEMYLKARPHGFGKKKRYTRSMVKLKGFRNAVRVV